MGDEIYSSLEIEYCVQRKKGKSRTLDTGIIEDVIPEDEIEKKGCKEDGGRKARTHAEWEWRGCVRHTSSHDLL